MNTGLIMSLATADGELINHPVGPTQHSTLKYFQKMQEIAFMNQLLFNFESLYSTFNESEMIKSESFAKVYTTYRHFSQCHFPLAIWCTNNETIAFCSRIVYFSYLNTIMYIQPVVSCRRLSNRMTWWQTRMKCWKYTDQVLTCILHENESIE